MSERVSVELLHGQRSYTGPHGYGIVDLEHEPHWKYAHLEVRGPDTQQGHMEARIDARGWDDTSWTTLGTLGAPMNHQTYHLSVELDPSKELVRYNIWAGSGNAEIYCKLTLSDERNSNE